MKKVLVRIGVVGVIVITILGIGCRLDEILNKPQEVQSEQQ